MVLRHAVRFHLCRRSHVDRRHHDYLNLLVGLLVLFGKPIEIRVTSETGSSTATARPRRRFQSSRLIGEYEKPWLQTGKRRWDWDRTIFYSAIGIALALSGFICYHSVASVPKNDYCLILDDDFSTLDTNTWNHEVQLNGWGTGSFDWTTSDPRNSFVDAEGLHIVPTLTLQDTDITPAQMVDGHVVNLTAAGTCTTQDQRLSNLTTVSKCSIRSNVTAGQIINPVRSARLTTAGKKMIKYGRVEVVAKLPAGDWLWPAIWMMPQDSVYGPWPASGEIDIAESRGNDAQRYPLGNNIISSSMHWGTIYDNDAYKLSTGEWGSKRTKYSDGYHTFGLEWSEKYLFTWLDGRLRQVLFFDFTKNKNMWTYGKFAGTDVNGSAPYNPWSSGVFNTPFDQPFYLILNVAVGATNGYFPDQVGSKPWMDKSDTSMRDFWMANSSWLPTWGDTHSRAMIVKSVRMWQQGSC
ncbi:glycosyl hydrolase family protein [Aspergillus clavatus NRRL 1]|uniref:Glycosyl hydrolase family protein n=1 Tax=Aspergillus clavatus (strain ATCC 1007 / CBS 513.65 / DSM 816 / NCTC 3887 / NRRL 1 / QM 1276 / 107) TaxID=344612 RepID=A1CSF5_ASPCL|nr:glycosyl hydrolase family protein [Aspergillus clavatus NRRL 1]EAW08576.1 glycosyl hydrolase family protein [Aspergillus clavatus NRRL 1]